MNFLGLFIGILIYTFAILIWGVRVGRRSMLSELNIDVEKHLKTIKEVELMKKKALADCEYIEFMKKDYEEWEKTRKNNA